MAVFHGYILTWSSHGTTYICAKSKQTTKPKQNKTLLLPKQKVPTLVIPLLNLHHDLRTKSTQICMFAFIACDFFLLYL